MLMSFLFWMLLNVVVPVLGPMFMLALVAPTHGVRVARNLIAQSMREGQLFWASIALSAAAVHEAVLAFGSSPEMHDVAGVAIVVFVLAAFGCSIVVMVSTTDAYSKRGSKVGDREAQWPTDEGSAQRGTLVNLSIWSAAMVAVFFGFLHAYVSW